MRYIPPSLQQARTVVVLHFCIHSIIVGVVGTFFVTALYGDTAWPVISYVACMAAITPFALLWLCVRSMRLRAA
jgi:DHA1 family florfenicol/chloramphenicol resistance protein-like MFS transporter